MRWCQRVNIRYAMFLCKMIVDESEPLSILSLSHSLTCNSPNITAHNNIKFENITKLPKKTPRCIFSPHNLRGPVVESSSCAPSLSSSIITDIFRKLKHGGIYSPLADINPTTTVDPYNDRAIPRTVVYTPAKTSPRELVVAKDSKNASSKSLE